MSISGHETPPAAITVLHEERRGTTSIGTHSHAGRHQVFWSPEGALVVEAEDRDWVLPPSLALWVPAGVPHAVRSSTDVWHWIYVDADRSAVDWATPTVVAATPLMRELIGHLRAPGLTAPARHHAEAVLFDLMVPLEHTRIDLPMPADPRARAVAEAVLRDPGRPHRLAGWAARLHVSDRTLTRAFVEQTGLTYTRWRAQARLRAALELLAQGVAVGSVARRVGYATPSAFVEAFQRATGQTPGTYFKR